ncbi:hypothetical protein DSUL_20059 [Desulfovibrionales bacterium]
MLGLYRHYRYLEVKLLFFKDYYWTAMDRPAIIVVAVLNYF